MSDTHTLIVSVAKPWRERYALHEFREIWNDAHRQRWILHHFREDVVETPAVLSLETAGCMKHRLETFDRFPWLRLREFRIRVFGNGDLLDRWRLAVNYAGVEDVRAAASSWLPRLPKLSTKKWSRGRRGRAEKYFLNSSLIVSPDSGRHLVHELGIDLDHFAEVDVYLVYATPR